MDLSERVYKIVRSNRKTLSLTVTRKGEIVVRAPKNVSESYIAAFVAKHAAWIDRKLESVRKSTLDLSDGATLTLFGAQYTIEAGRTAREEHVLYLPSSGREEALIRFLKGFSAEIMELFTERIAARYGFSYSRVRISSARGRWGSCNREGVIAYSFRIAFLPPRLIEYVVVHELSHTVCFDHSPTFWNVVGQVLPDWKTLRKTLKIHSEVMNWL